MTLSPSSQLGAEGSQSEAIAAELSLGADSFVSRLTLEAKQTGSQPQSEMMRSLTSLIKWIGFLVIPLAR